MYSNEAKFCCGGVQKIVQVERGAWAYARDGTSSHDHLTWCSHKSTPHPGNNPSDSRATGNFTGLSVHADQLALFDKERDANRDSCF